MSTQIRAATAEALPAIALELQQCVERCPDIDGCIVSTVDGHQVDTLINRPMATERLATMNCSAMALAETMARESDQGMCQFLILENTDGRIVMLRINRQLLLTCLSTLDSNLGMVLNVGQRTATALALVVKRTGL